jgi:hypothetical protein
MEQQPDFLQPDGTGRRSSADPRSAARCLVHGTTLVLTNTSAAPIDVQGPHGDCQLTCPQPVRVPFLRPDTTVNVESMVASQSIPAAFLRTKPGDAIHLNTTLRTQDISRANETWGTTLPIVRERDLFASTFGLTGIATDPQFRSILRIYDVDATTPPQARVRIYRVRPGASVKNPPTFADELLQELTPVFALPQDDFSRFWFPGYAQIPLSIDEELVAAGQIRIEIEPLDGRAEYWAFVSVTHNETQHVTLVLPN